MGIDAADVDGDGWQDVYITHLDFELNRLYHNNRDGTFTDDTFGSGMGNKAILLSGVAMKFLDHDNSGWNDILQLNGAMLDNIQLYHSEVTVELNGGVAGGWDGSAGTGLGRSSSLPYGGGKETNRIPWPS